MSSIVHRRSPDPRLTLLAYDILTTQHGQIGIMSGWLTLWGQSAGSTGRPMEWMGKDHPPSMQGMASKQEIAALLTLPIAPMEEEFLRMMIRHHRGALPMATYAAENAASPHVGSLARKMLSAQESEIDLMQDMLVARGAAPEPDRTAMRMDGANNTGHPR